MTPPVSFHQSLDRLLAAHPATRRLLVGYSGGMDSHVLLHLLAMGRARWPERILEAVYVHHGLHAAAAAWGEHCGAVCRELGVPFRILRVNAAPAPGASPEAAARHARYAALAAELGPDAALLTAHHRDDQAETLLLQLVRGAGPHGLAAMPMVARLGPGGLWRPLLDRDRAELRAYADEHALRWIEDPSNDHTDFDRNYLRHRILPLLRERWPAANRTLARSARWCAETTAGLDAEADADLAGVATDRTDSLSLPALRRLSEPRQRNLLRYWLRRLHLPMPNARQMAQLLHDTLSAARDRNPCMRWPGAELRRYRDGLYALPPLPPHDAGQLRVWRSAAAGWPPLELPGIGTLEWRETVGAGLRRAALAKGALCVGFRQGGERFQPAGRSGSQELKKLLQEAGIPPWERERLPLVYGAGHESAVGQGRASNPPGATRQPSLVREQLTGCRLLAVVGLGVAADQAAAPGEPGWELVLQSPPAARLTDNTFSAAGSR